jgi:hypothetical protein
MSLSTGRILIFYYFDSQPNVVVIMILPALYSVAANIQILSLVSVLFSTFIYEDDIPTLPNSSRNAISDSGFLSWHRCFLS